MADPAHPDRVSLARSGVDRHGLDRAANLLGALALAVSDRSADAVSAAAGRSDSAAAALSALLHFLDRPTIDRLRQVLGLTSSGTVRLVDRLEESGYVCRVAGQDARSTAVMLTEAGVAAAEQVSAARTAVLLGSLSVLSDEERETFEHLISKMLTGMIRGPGATRWTCRLCDIGVCAGAPGGCPVGNAARERYLKGATPAGG
ncbi:MAG TPA: MarR family winged helix-turn-helix transcriptional regulator [Streptosporangiaceae bacterium]|nr:MarR family winged helix-turn-helix transcriptional regulator [Streptosporangiaceae bacterium]